MKAFPQGLNRAQLGFTAFLIWFLKVFILQIQSVLSKARKTETF